MSRMSSGNEQENRERPSTIVEHPSQIKLSLRFMGNRDCLILSAIYDLLKIIFYDLSCTINNAVAVIELSRYPSDDIVNKLFVNKLTI